MKLQYAFFGIATLIILSGTASYAQIVGTPSAGVIPAMTTVPVQPMTMPSVTGTSVPFGIPTAPLAPPVAATSTLQPIGIVGQPIFSITNSIQSEPVIIRPLGSIQIESLPGIFPGTFATSSPPVAFPIPAR